MKLLGPHSTDRQQALAKERCNRLTSRIRTWYLAQQLYLPGAEAIRSREGRSPPTPILHPWDMELCLPSEIGTRAPCNTRLQEYELKLREGQANDALEDLRDSLRLRTHLYEHKKANLRGQKQNTRSQTTIKRTTDRANTAAAKYRGARTAMLRLSRLLRKDRQWREAFDKRFRELRDEDIRSISKDLAYGDPTKKGKKKGKTKGKKDVSEGRRTLSWIWASIGVGASAGVDASLYESEFILTNLSFSHELIGIF